MLKHARLEDDSSEAMQRLSKLGICAPCPALPCPALPCPALPCPALRCPPWGGTSLGVPRADEDLFGLDHQRRVGKLTTVVALDWAAKEWTEAKKNKSKPREAVQEYIKVRINPC